LSILPGASVCGIFRLNSPPSRGREIRKGKEERQAKPKNHSDGEVLDLIEDFLVNQFGKGALGHNGDKRGSMIGAA
jgi:hypothetical protein